MPDPVRVRDNDTGHEYSTYAVSEDGEVYDGLTVLKDEPAMDALGNLLPPKYPEPVSEPDATVAEPGENGGSASTTVETPTADPSSTETPAAIVEPPASAETTPATTAKTSAKAPRPTAPTTDTKTPKEA